MITNVYIDGMNLFYGCLKRTPYKWLDLVALSQLLVPGDEIHQVRYFTARVIGAPHNPNAARRQDVYLRALSASPQLVLHLGHYRRDPVWMPVVDPPPLFTRVFKTEEKGSDVNLASYMLRDAFKNECEMQLVITNDSDLGEPINIVRRELGMTVGVVNPGSPSKRTRRLRGDFLRQIRPTDLEQSQLQTEVKVGDRLITKPAEW